MQDDRETAKQRLQRLIRDFAHDAVGTGLAVEVSTEESSEDSFQGTLRLDRRLSQVEIWRPGEGASSTLTLPFNQVKSVAKVEIADFDISEAKDVDASSLTIESHQKPTIRLNFDSVMSRDRAYTCLRIFHMSIDQPVAAG
ncbi:Ferredoxin [Symbiodinium natans]|uniref:Ferredoxin protein n=1 Tax=Symbiodinium natans TaxID=878477 RepID=A0A812NV68_9DINO|nr:Ferredoxin [Symbiodinium natans]